jgi:hypothetical protein
MLDRHPKNYYGWKRKGTVEILFFLGIRCFLKKKERENNMFEITSQMLYSLPTATALQKSLQCLRMVTSICSGGTGSMRKRQFLPKISWKVFFCCPPTHSGRKEA